jgi:tetratricopeptide (TPR) repeat protein
MMRLPVPRAAVCSLLASVTVGHPGLVLGLADSDVLPPDVAVTRELAAGETHVFQFTLDAGQLLEAAVQQQGVDVAVTVFAPDGTAALTVNSMNDPTRVERVLWVAYASGAHSVGLRAAADRPAGRYRILLDPPRTATPGDVMRVSAQRDLERAVRVWRGVGENTAQGRPEALRRLESALGIFRSEGDRRGAAAALEEIAGVQGIFNHQAEALASAEEALSLYRELGDRPGEIAALGRIGWASYSLGDTRRGEQLLQDVLREARRTSNEWRESICLNDLGTIYRRRGDAEKAVEGQQQAIAKSRASGNRRGEAFSLNNIGIAYKELGEYGEALESHEAALPLFQALNDALGETRVRNNMANVYRLQGDDARARDVYLQVLAFARGASPGGDEEAAALNNLASVSYRLGDYGEALEHSRRALEMRTGCGVGRARLRRCTTSARASTSSARATMR